jgi:predicted phage tail protein
MPNSKLIAVNSAYGEAAFMNRVSNILNCLTDHPKFPEPWSEHTPPLVLVRSQDTNYRKFQLAVQNRDLRQIHNRDEARAVLENSLRRVAAYIELVADGDMSVLATTGFEVRREPGRPSRNAIPVAVTTAPEDFRVGTGTYSGSILVYASNQQGAIAYEIQVTRSDPANEEGWKQAVIVANVRKVLIENLEPGAVWVRVRAVHRRGQSSPWTLPISVVVR